MAPLPKICYTSCNDETGSYTLPKEDPKICKSPYTPPVILLTSACFQWKSVNFAISRYADKDWILVHNF